MIISKEELMYADAILSQYIQKSKYRGFNITYTLLEEYIQGVVSDGINIFGIRASKSHDLSNLKDIAYSIRKVKLCIDRIHLRRGV